MQADATGRKKITSWYGKNVLVVVCDTVSKHVDSLSSAFNNRDGGRCADNQRNSTEHTRILSIVQYGPGTGDFHMAKETVVDQHITGQIMRFCVEQIEVSAGKRRSSVTVIFYVHRHRRPHHHFERLSGQCYIARRSPSLSTQYLSLTVYAVGNGSQDFRLCTLHAKIHME